MNHWALTVSTKQLSHGNAARCIDKLTGSTPGDASKYKDRATAIIAQEQKDLEAFTASVTFK